jgi:hypothetical protein
MAISLKADRFSRIGPSLLRKQAAYAAHLLGKQAITWAE